MMAQNTGILEFLEYASDEELLLVRGRMRDIAREYNSFCDEFESVERASCKICEMENEIERLERDLCDFKSAVTLIGKTHSYLRGVMYGHLTVNEMQQQAELLVNAINKFNHDIDYPR